MTNLAELDYRVSYVSLMLSVVFFFKILGPIPSVFVVLGSVLFFRIIGLVLLFSILSPVLSFEILRPVFVMTHLTELNYRMTFISMFKISTIRFSMLLSGLVFGVFLFRAILGVFFFFVLSLVFGLNQLCIMLAGSTQSSRLNFGPISFILLPSRVILVMNNVTRSLA